MLPTGYTADPQDGEQQAQQQSILKQILTPAAHERLNRVKLVRDLASLETRLVEMAVKGELSAQITESQLISMLEKGQSTQPKIRFDRKHHMDDDDDNDDDLM